VPATMASAPMAVYAVAVAGGHFLGKLFIPSKQLVCLGGIYV